MIARSHSSIIKLESLSEKNLMQKLELTPLIDIIFIVIVFLLLTANVRLLSLPVTVPETDDVPSNAANELPVINITVSKDNQGWFIEKDFFSEWPLFRSQLLDRLYEQKNAQIALAADQQADVQRFVKVLTLLQQQQITDTRIIVNNH